MTDIGFRPLLREDFSLLSEWLSAPHVEKWWREDPSIEGIEKRYGPAVDGKDPTELFVIEYDGVAVGMAQRYLIRDDPKWQKALEPTGAPEDSVGIDYLVGSTSLIGKGHGSEMIRRFTEATFERYPDSSTITADVEQANLRSWGALENAGFVRVWEGELESEEPNVEGPTYVYFRRRSKA